jgi:hypothetical protein
MSLTAGTRLGPYEILGALGAGGMGEVYLARDPRLGRDVAIKVLPPHLANDPDALKRFEREARAVAALSHPNILAIFDVGSDQGLTYAVMELLEGETLRPTAPRCDAVAGGRRHRRLDWRRAVDRACQGRHPPRSQTREHLSDIRGARESARLRAGTSRAGSRRLG